MQPPEQPQTRIQRAFSPLPLELFLQVLDQLVGTRDGRQQIAYAPSDPATNALRALALTSRSIYPLASRYLYAHCLYLQNCINYARFRRTLGLSLGYHPEALPYGEAGRNEQLFCEADISRHITSLFVSPQKTEQCGNAPMVRLPQIIDLFTSIGPTLKRLAIDLQPVYTPGSEIRLVKPHIASNNIFLGMPKLEELVCSFDVSDYFPYPPPNLKRLAMTFQDIDDSHLTFCFSISSLEMLFFLRPEGLDAKDINELFSRYKGRHLDIGLVAVNANHRTPKYSRTWTEDDRVTIWEVDVPTSYYGDEDEMILCDGWIWSHGVQGTLWGQAKRRMTCWREIERRLASDHVSEQA
ncbi:hypothetical protein BU26DRAFT_515290 [Trematosphaeria pertusa]|uniref:F-box domain-containing protein n=1 Tax=Trematosphaeria pertusa TaxID=390896 RepID=A0A6A6IS14_9PLEO|nr:uncharacterized protein BU26DRAFT_515290 [Trematosphaeria pertusa]KAF2252858.1 hypothetical protein BU26DRAFT_515290 [Trematosphaeria pertusa]